jgi:hypothetical protein
MLQEDLVLHCAMTDAADYSARKIGHFEASECTFTNCNFTRMQIDYVSFASGTGPTIYQDCRFDFSRMREAVGGPARFERCSFENVRIDLLRCEATEFVDCRFSGRLHGYFNGTPQDDWRARLRRDKNEFSGNDFSRAEICDVSFRTGIDLSLQNLPIAPEKYFYSRRPELCIRTVREKALAWRPDDAEKRREVFSFIQVLEWELEGGQKELFICLASMKPGSEAREFIRQALAACT